MDNEIKKDLASNWFKLLQNAICNDISRLEKNKIKFKSTSWQRSKDRDEGGGEYRIIKNGKVFEKVGVNFSKVYGKFPKKFQKNIPGASKDPRFWASGISIVMHMQNPHIPAIHFNTRQRIWGVLIMGSFHHHDIHAMVHQLGHQGVKFQQGSLEHILDFRIFLVMVVSSRFFVFPKRGGPDHQNVVGALCNGCCHG